MKALLVGDFSPTAENEHLFREKNIPELFTDAISIFDSKDLVAVNLECAITESENGIKKFGPCLRAPTQTAQVMQSIGVNLCGLSNNHIFDYGIRGMKDTFDALGQVGIPTTGFGNNYEDARKNFSFEHNGEKICVVAVCEHEYSYALEDRMGSRPFDEYDTIEDIRLAKAEHDRVIVMYHGGKELCQYPSPRLLKLCRAMARNGADVILCQHSHCIGCYENYNGSHILYGQGNFHFVKSKKADVWYNSLAVEYDTVTNEIYFTPLKCTEHGIALAGGEEGEKIMRDFTERSKTLLDGKWREGWREFCESRRAGYTKAIGQAFNPTSTAVDNARFGHYLDCEAHTDVWRELFPTYNQTNEKTTDIENAD